MPPAKRVAQDDSRSDGSTIRERQVAAAAHARSKKNAANGNSHTAQNGSPLKELALVSTESGHVVAPSQQGTGVSPPPPYQYSAHIADSVPQQMQWNTAPRELLDTYRLAHQLPVPAAFTSPRNQALLSNPGIGKQSPTMARRKDKRRTSKEQLALAVRKNFNAAAVSEIDVVVELVYKVRHQSRWSRTSLLRDD